MRACRLVGVVLAMAIFSAGCGHKSDSGDSELEMGDTNNVAMPPSQAGGADSATNSQSGGSDGIWVGGGGGGGGGGGTPAIVPHYTDTDLLGPWRLVGITYEGNFEASYGSPEAWFNADGRLVVWIEPGYTSWRQSGDDITVIQMDGEELTYSYYYSGGNKDNLVLMRTPYVYGFVREN